MQQPTNDVETPNQRLCILLDYENEMDEVKRISEITELLKEYPDVVNEPVDHATSWYPLMEACRNCPPIIVRKILKCNPVIDRIDLTDGLTELMIACKYNQDCIEMLLSYGANVNLHDYHGDTPLMWGCHAESLSKRNLKRLLRSGTNPSNINIFGQTAFTIACENGNVTLATQMLKIMNIDFTHDMVTALLEACRYAKIPIIEFLLENGAVIKEEQIDVTFNLQVKELLKSQLVKQLKQELQLQKDTFQQNLKDQFEELKIQLLEEFYAPGKTGELSTEKHFEEMGKYFDIK
jgi:ankyrin repeat protein